MGQNGDASSVTLSASDEIKEVEKAKKEVTEADAALSKAMQRRKSDADRAAAAMKSSQKSKVGASGAAMTALRAIYDITGEIALFY